MSNAGKPMPQSIRVKKKLGLTLDHCKYRRDNPTDSLDPNIENQVCVYTSLLGCWPTPWDLRFYMILVYCCIVLTCNFWGNQSWPATTWLQWSGLNSTGSRAAFKVLTECGLCHWYNILTIYIYIFIFIHILIIIYVVLGQVVIQH